MASGWGEAEGIPGARSLQNEDGQSDESGAFHFYLITPSSAKAVVALVHHGGGSRSTVVNFLETELPEGSKPFLRDRRCWQPCGPATIDSRFLNDGSVIRVGVIFSKKWWKVVLDDAARWLSQPSGGRTDGTEQTFALRRGRLQIEVFRGDAAASRNYDASLWMALVTNLVLLSNPYNVSDCFREYSHHRLRFRWSSTIDVNDGLKRSAQWFQWIQQEPTVSCNSDSSGTSQATKTALALISKFNLLQSLQQAERSSNLDKKLLIKSYEALLSPLCEVISVLGPPETMPPLAAQELQVGVSHIVAFTSPHSVMWSSCLDSFCSVDLSYSFLRKWTAGEDDLREAEKTYEMALSEVFRFADTFQDKSFKSLASRAAVLAAPTTSNLFRSLRAYYCSNVLFTDSSKQAEEDLSTTYGQDLFHRFRKLTQLETPGDMALSLLCQLEIEDEPMLTVLRILSASFLASQVSTSGRTYLAETSARKDKLDGWEYFFNLIKCPHSFCLPLLQKEITFISDVASSSFLHLAADVISELAGKFEALHDNTDKERIFELLRTWLQRVCTNAIAARQVENQGLMTPYQLCTRVTNLFEKGLEGPGFLADCLGQIIRMSLHRERFEIQIVLQDTRIMSHFPHLVISTQFHLHAEDMILKYLETESEGHRTKGMDKIAEDLLLWICSSSNGSTTVTGWIQDALCVALLDFMVDFYGKNASLSSEALVESRFLLLMLQAEEAGPKMRHHALFTSASRALTKLFKELETESSLLDLVNKVMVYSQINWQKVCKAQNLNTQSLRTAWKAAHDYHEVQLKGFEMLLESANFLEGFGFSRDVIQENQSWLVERNVKCKHFSLRDIRELDHWPVQPDMKFFKSMLTLEQSKVLRSILKSEASNIRAAIPTITGRESLSLWINVTELMRSSLKCYNEEWHEISRPNCAVGKLSFLLDGIARSSVELEIELAERYLRSCGDRAALSIRSTLEPLSSWVHLRDMRSLVDPLLKVESMFSIERDDTRILDTLQSLCDSCTSGTLDDFLVLYNKNIEVINYFSTREAVILKQLAESELLIGFLKENSDDDLRVLTDAVEEQAEGATVDEAIVSDLIHIDKVFRPLLQSPRFTMTDLKLAIEMEVKDSLEGATQFAGKLNNCNANVQRIRHFVASLADRGSVLKDHMHNILKSGVYNFVLESESEKADRSFCRLSVSCNGPSMPLSNHGAQNQFTLSDLRDLRSRARMILSSKRMKPDLQSRLIEDNRLSDTVHALMEFVDHVNLAQKVVDQISTLHHSGHLFFEQVDWRISGLPCLKQIVEQLDAQIANWNAALLRSRELFSCLNFFTGTELRLIYSCFTSEVSSTHIAVCCELLQWAQPGLNTAQLQKTLSKLDTIKPLEFDSPEKFCQKTFSAWTNETVETGNGRKTALKDPGLETSEAGLEHFLKVLSEVIESTFGAVKPEVVGRGESLLPNVNSGHETVLVSVQDEYRELNVVVEIFQRQGIQLRGNMNNLLLCSAITSWEELHLLLLRYLAFDPTDSVSNTFIIAFIEKLSFECQLQLMDFLQQVFRTTGPRLKRQLALVCSSSSPALQGISHHLRVPIQYMNGYAYGDILQYLPDECCQMKVVTSEVSGLGKTRSIFLQTVGSIVTLCLSGALSRKSLIMVLKGLKLTARDALHLDITTEEGYDNLNLLLFELLVCGALKSSHVGVYRLETSLVYVELANTLGNRLASSLSVCSWLPQQHLVWQLDSLQVSDDLESDEQVVCAYLDKMELNELDNMNIYVSGVHVNVSALPAIRCRQLLNTYFINDSVDMSFSVLTGFIKVFAGQLRRLSATDFYSVETLRWMLRAQIAGTFRSTLVSSLLQAAAELSLRSVKPWLQMQQQQIVGQDMSTSMHDRMSSLLRWSESNHVMVFFDLYGPITVLYRDRNLIPQGIKTIMSIQVQAMGMDLKDYSAMSSEQLWQVLWPILCKEEPVSVPNYALTPDNFLKMALISLRINARVPVIIMGEAGCGKTSLLRALASFSSATFSTLTVHAGSTEQDIKSFIYSAEGQASSKTGKVWAFVDEINACHHMGLLNGLLCHHSIDGRPLHARLVVLAACNPYRLQDPRVQEIGIALPSRVGETENHELAYKVQPLPEAMLDYVWDYGILSDSDERAYIAAMVGQRSEDIIDLLSNSQMFMRTLLGVASVSLRDIQRWILFYDWFQIDIGRRPMLHKSSRNGTVEVRAKILACSLCYHCRFHGNKERELYREMCCYFLNLGLEEVIEASGQRRAPAAIYLDILREEQMDILNRMEIPFGIARNESLLENVFVVLVSMLNHIPVFVVGKPGSGKTLALQIIYSSLRGTDSKDDYLKKLPRMLLLSYQGSQSSTSEGILKVFEKAHRYVLSNRKRDILVVVVLDEVGLAETSQHNPLKVLHPLLEPDVQEVAVVGISNWSLDAAKMNRGIHLSQPDPGEDDLYQTSLAILSSYTGGNTHFLSVMIRSLVAAYHKYHSCQTRANFHGLRDFYSLIKSLRKCKRTTTYTEQLSDSLWRNFGGSFADTRNLFSIVEQVMGCTRLTNKLPAVTDLIKQNLHDTEARHLLLITRGDSASGILMHMLRKDEDFAVIRGSTYEDDKNEEYCYLMLSDIILHMEMGRCILLENADQIWSSLYDMLNQHYMIVGGRRHCRIALGSYSNPMCYVHDSFRCIVVVDIDQIPSMDPPFLNRFEKQVFTYESILDEFQKRAVQSVRSWAHELAAMSCPSKYHDKSQFLERELFAGYYEDSVPSLVMLHSSETQEVGFPDGWSTVLDRCKAGLLRTAYVDAIARAHLSKCSNAGGVQHWTGMFLSWSELQCLLDCLQAHIGNSENWSDDIGVKMIVTTSTPMHWNVHLDSESIAGYSLKVQSMRLGDFSSERQLQAHIQQFWKDSCANLLIIQADDIMDKSHIPLAKSHLDKARAACLAGNITIRKHLVFIIHVHHGETKRSNFSFLCGWEQLTLHQLQREALGIRDFLDSTIAEILRHKAMGIELVMPRVLAWSFLCIRFTDSNISAAYSQDMVRCICKDDALVACIMQRALTWVSSRNPRLWQMSVLNNRKLLSTSASVHAAFLQYVEEQFREAVARLIYLLEKTSSIRSYFTYDTKKQRIWREVLLKPEVIDCGMAPAPCYPEGYEISTPMDLRLPFSSVYAAHLDRTFKEAFLEKFPKHLPENLLGQSKKLHGQIDAAVGPSIGDIKTFIHLYLDDYIADFATIYTKDIGTASSMCAVAFQWVLREQMGSKICHPSDLHVLNWVRGEELEAQAAMASGCLSSAELELEVNAMQEGRLPNRSFTEDLALRCYSNLLPTEVLLRTVGGTQCWLQKSRTLLKLAPAVRSPQLVFLLQVLHDLTCTVILPLKLNSKPLCLLAACLQKQLSDVDLPTILDKVLALLPDLTWLAEAEQNSWLDFLCSVVKRYLEVASLGDKHIKVVLSALLNWPRPTSLMGHVIFRTLNIRSAAAEVPRGRRCPNIVVFLLERNTVAGYNWQEDINHAGNILLSDRLYDDLRRTITPGLLCGEDADTWDSLAFDKFLCVALTSDCEDAAHNLPRRLGALALIKCFLYSVAAFLVETCGRQDMKGSEGTNKVIILPASTRALTSVSPALRSAMQVFLMKVLHWELGQSASDILKIESALKQRVLFKDLSCLLDHIILRKGTSRLGYDPFLTSSDAFATAEMALTDLLSADSRRMDDLLRNVGGQEQEAAVVAAVASNLFLPKSGRDLSGAEQTSLTLLRDIVDQSSNCAPITKQSLGHLMGNDPGGLLHVETNLPTDVLRFRCLAADILVKVAALSVDSPLRAYCTLNPSYFVEGHVLTAPEGAFAAVSGIGKFKDYSCSCGFRYIIGDCTRPDQVGTCPQCKGTIGGINHRLEPGNIELRTSATGKVLVSSVVTNVAYCVRIQPLSYRILRVLVNYCFLIGVASGKAREQLARFLDLPDEQARISSELASLIEQDLLLLDQLLACRREMTYQYMHCVVASLSTVSVAGPFQTADTRDQWEMAFDRLIEHLPVQEAVDAYLDRQGTDTLNRMLQERIPCLPDSLQGHFRMTRTPCLVHYESIFLQDTRRAAEYPCTTAMLAHASQLDSLVFLLPIAEFSTAVHDVLGHTFTRHTAAATTVREMLQTTVELEELYPAFERCWNSVRLNVKGYECRVFKEPIPEMHMDQPVALCLLEKKDQGIYLTAILELLRTNQNTFLQDVASAYGLLEYASADKRFDVSETRSFPSVPVQLCKAEHLVKFEQSWADELVREAGMCEQSYGNGTNVHYDDVQIELQVFHKLIQGKALLTGDYREFPYQQESFQRHATLISDVTNLVPQEALFSETVSNIGRELDAEGSGAGQLLASLDLCLGFLRKTSADPREMLREYCERWLETNSHLIFSKAVFDNVQVRHIVSLYEGLEDVASSTVEDLVSSSYRAPLEEGTLRALLDCVAIKNCSVQAGSSVLGAEAFRDVLRRFMYRYLTSDTFKRDEGLGMYLTDPRLVRWPADDVDAQTLDEVFPSTLQLKHSRAIYLALKEMCQ